MCETSNTPEAFLTDMCSSIMPVYCTGSKKEANAQLEEWFKDDDICGETNGYPKFEYGCDETCWNQIVSQNQPTAPDTGNALARYLLDLRL